MLYDIQNYIMSFYGIDNNKNLGGFHRFLGSGQVCHVYHGFQGLCTRLLVYKTTCVPGNHGTHDKLDQIPFFQYSNRI